ncbi:hypothetical protein RHMOL_Rhmol05G0068600 [Rhododendron molle]|uniref:Uncharacterized protein n=1 Tax=Rhododendron molle TaxID=49168 RepID=A0ACC0NNI9_RHOML|nr:hypothetical protein RHMOL_Rhmol05G0068600 [Rhododendron molle]
MLINFADKKKKPNSINEILSYNKDHIPNKDLILTTAKINVPFTCDCIGGEFLGHVFPYMVSSGDTYDVIAETYYANLTTAAWLERFNVYEPSRILDNVIMVNMTVNCSCRDAAVSRAYGLFVTCPLNWGWDSLESIADRVCDIKVEILRPRNHGLSGGVIAGISTGGVVGALLVVACIKCVLKKVPDVLPSSKRDIELNPEPGKGISPLFLSSIPVYPDGESQLSNQSQGASDGDDKKANAGGGVSAGDVSIGNITINLGNMDTEGG